MGIIPEGTATRRGPPLPSPPKPFAPGPSPGALYGSGYEGNPFFQGSQDSVQGATMARRSPLAALGFDPARIEKKTEMPMYPQGIAAGLYYPDTDRIEVGADGGRILGGPDTVAHEAMHRGIAAINRYMGGAREGSLVHKLLKDQDMQEAVVRVLSHRAAGTTPDDWEKKNFPAVVSPDIIKLADALERMGGGINDLKMRRGRKGGPR